MNSLSKIEERLRLANRRVRDLEIRVSEQSSELSSAHQQVIVLQVELSEVRKELRLKQRKKDPIEDKSND